MKAKGAKRKKSAIVRHGVYSQRDKMPARIKREAVFLREKIICDLADTEDKLTGAELILLDRAINIYGVTRKIELHIARVGVVDSKGNLQPILAKNYVTYINSLRLILRELGIKGRAEELLSPADWEVEEETKK